MWPILLCHNSMSASALRPLANIADFISWESKMNIRPCLRPRAKSSLPFRWSTLCCWSELACLVPQPGRRRPNSSLSMEHAKRSWCGSDCPLRRMGHYRHVEWGELWHPQFPHRQVIRASVALRTNPHQNSCGWMHPSRRTIHLLSWRCCVTGMTI